MPITFSKYIPYLYRISDNTLNAPDVTKDHIAGSTKIAEYNSSPDTPVLTIRNITAVGATFGSSRSLSQRDQNWLRNSIECCQQNGFDLSKDFRITPLNISYGQSFLDPKFSCISTDMLVICYIYHRGASEYAKDLGKTENSGFRQCKHHFEEGAWRDAAQKSGAKFIVVFSSYIKDREITAKHFAGDKYVVASPALPVYAINPNTETLCDRRMEMLVRKDIAKHIKLKNPSILSL